MIAFGYDDCQQVVLEEPMPEKKDWGTEAVWFGQEVYEGLERWVKAHRDKYPKGEECPEVDIVHDAIDAMLDEVRDCGVEGLLPWQKM